MSALAAAAWVAGAPRAAIAQGASGLPVADLPPFPDVATEEDKVLFITVVGASHAEEDVVVGASKREQSLGTVASAVTIIAGDRLRRFGYRTLAEALGAVVGLYIVDDRMVQRIGIRGIQLLGDANTRILVLVDGSPLNEPWSQYVDASYALPVHLDDVARIEVIRGPVSSIYGTNAFFGIINIVTLEADKAPRAYGRFGVGSFGSVTGNAGAGYGGLNRQVRASVAFLNRGGEAVTYPDFGEIGGNPVTHADGMQALNGSLVVHYDRLFFQVRAADRARELAGAPYDSAIGDAGNRIEDTQALGEAGYTQDLGDHVTVSTRAYVDRYRSRTDLAYDGMPSFQSVGNSTWYGGEVRGLFEIVRGRLALTAGLAAEWSRTDSESFTVDADGNRSAVLSVERPFRSQGIYAELEATPLTWMSVTAGARHDQNSLFDDNLSPRGALLFHKADQYGLKFLYATGFRNPSIFEAYYEDGARYRPSGLALFPELITSYETVLWGHPIPGLNLRLSAWKWTLEKLIEKRSVYDPAALAERLQFQNLFAGLSSQGVEVEGSYRDTRGWLAFGSATLSFVAHIIGDEPVMNAPRLTATAGASSPLLFGRFHASAELSFLSARHTRDPELDADPHVDLNLAVYLPSYRGCDVTLGVRNLLGLREQIPAQIDYDRQAPAVDVFLIPGAGREFYARVGYRY